MLKKHITYIFLIIFGTSIFAQESAQDINCLHIDHKGKTREQFVDFTKLILNVKFNTKEEKVFGTANYQFKPLRSQVTSLFLDAPNIVIYSILLDDKLINFDYVEGGINLLFEGTLFWDKEYSLSIKYETRPLKGLYFVGWNDPTKRSLKQIWTQGQGIDNRHWVPSFDAVNDKLITETIITFETGYEVISNGVLKKKTINNDQTTWHYAMDKPQSIYLIMIAIGKYKFKDYASNNGITSRQYFYEGQDEKEKPTYAHTNKMMNWFEAELGVPYQWKIYKNVPVKDFMYGAMENTTATIFTDYYLQNEREAKERSYVATNAHELAHHWFGDLVTEWGGTHHWLHESFATYYSKHFMREIDGENAYQWKKREEQLAAFEASKNNHLPIAHSEAGSSRHYPKGSYVIDMLRYVVGDQEFKKTIKDFLDNHAFDMVDTHDFQMQFMKSVGMNVDWFFNEWIYKGGEPEYKVDYKTRMNKTVFTVEQVHQQTEVIGLFKMPIVFQVHYKDGTFDEVKQWIENKIDTVVVPNKGMKKVEFVLFDPNNNILKKVYVNASYKEILAQAEKAPNMIDRYDAVEAMRSIEVDKKREDLIAIYLLDDYRAIKENILDQLKGDKNAKTEQLYVYALGDKDFKVRRKAMLNADISNKRYIKFYEEMLDDESLVNIEIALRKLCDEYPDNVQDYLNRTRNLDGQNYSLKLTWLDIAFDNNSKLAGGIVDYASESYDFRTRIKAIEIIQKKKYYDDIYIGHLLNAYLSFNNRLKSTAANHLKALLADKESGIKISKYVSNRTWFSHEQKILDDVLIEYGVKVYR